MDWRKLVINIPDYPKKGIQFKDITPLLAQGKAFAEAIEEMAEFCLQESIRPDVLACPEARGFIFASALAQRLKIGFIPLRKKGKLPRKVAQVDYDLEYGGDVLQVHVEDIRPGMRILLVDDILATGGTTAACIRLLQNLQAQVIGAAFLLEIQELKGRSRLPEIPILTLIRD